MRAKNILLILCFISLVSCAQEKSELLGETEWQREMNANFKDASKSPLTKKGLSKFKGLDFFKHDSAYVVTAKLTRTPDSQPFNMKTTTDREPIYRVYGTIVFSLKGKEHQLNIYQNLGLMGKEGFEDYLFLPFLDDTNGDTTYGGGRYIETAIPEGNDIVINFNEAFNPYCVYSKRYSCPIVPRINYIETEVNAGVKAYKKP